MVLYVVLTLFTVFCTAAAAFFAYHSGVNAGASYDALQEARKRTGKLDVAVEDIAALNKRLGKLAGRFYRELRDEPREEEQLELPAPVGHCENWFQAQRDGPQSEAARCQCAYCENARAARARIKAALTPKSQTDRIKSMRDGLGQTQ